MDTDINSHAYETVMELYPNKYNVGKKPTVKLYTDINRHAETQKNFNKQKHCSPYNSQNQPKTM